MDSIGGKSGLIHSSEFVFNIHEDHPSSITTRQISQYVVPPDGSFVMPPSCLYQRSPAQIIGTVQTNSTAHLNSGQRVVNGHTIIDSHCASSSSEPLDTLFVPIRIIMLGILPGFIRSTIRYIWAIVAPPKVITVVIQEVLRFRRTLTKLSPSIK